MMKIKLYRAVVLLICIGLLCCSAANAVESPTEQLKPTLEKLVSILSEPSLKGANNKIERRKVIMSTIVERFDFKQMSRRVLGKTWKSINADQQQHFIGLMTKLLENNYIGQLENYSGQTIEYAGERVKKNRAQVSTLIETNGAKYPVHYIMLNNGGKWMVYDINIEGVSLIRNYRAEFKSIIKREKFEGLVRVLEKKNKSFE